jgi:hypothetical protein
MLDELVALFVGRTAKEGRDDVVAVFLEPGIDGIAAFAVQPSRVFLRSLELRG